MKFFERFSVKKLYEDLEYWIFIGIGSDIVDLKYQRPEYSHLVEKFKNYPDETPKLALGVLREELKRPWYKRPSFWHLVKLNLGRLWKH